MYKYLNNQFIFRKTKSNVFLFNINMKGLMIVYAILTVLQVIYIYFIL